MYGFVCIMRFSFRSVLAYAVGYAKRTERKDGNFLFFIVLYVFCGCGDAFFDAANSVAKLKQQNLLQNWRRKKENFKKCKK